MPDADRYVHVIWCDDIRQEIGNKPSFMGVYTGGLVLPGLPCELPKLCAWLLLSAPADPPFGRISVRIQYDDGAPLVELSDVVVPPPPEAPDKAPPTRQNLMFGITIAPLQLPLGCKYLQPLVVWDGQELVGPRLNVEVNPLAVAAVQKLPPTL